LKDGMKVILRNGETGIVSNGCEKIISDSEGGYFLCYYNDDLTRNDNSPDADIISVVDVIWERKDETKEITIKDIEKMFGSKVKIVG